MKRLSGYQQLGKDLHLSEGAKVTGVTLYNGKIIAATTDGVYELDRDTGEWKLVIMHLEAEVIEAPAILHRSSLVFE